MSVFNVRGGSLSAFPYLSAGAITPTMGPAPVVLGAGGTVTAVADDGEAILGWTPDVATATGAETVHVILATEDTHWLLPLCGTVGGGDLTTTAGQTTAGAASTGVGTTLRALIGGHYALNKTSGGVYQVDLSDTTPAATLPLQLVSFRYNIANGLWEGECIVVPAARQSGTAVVV